MPRVIMASAEGEHALFQNVLNVAGSGTGKHRGSVFVSPPTAVFYRWEEDETSDDMWVHVLVAKENGTGNFATKLGTMIEIRSSEGYLAGYRTVTRSSNMYVQTQTATTPTSGTSLGGISYIYNSLVFVEFDFRFRISTVTDPDDTMTIDYYVQEQLRETYVLTDGGGWSPPRELYLRGTEADPGYGDAVYQDIIVTDALPSVGMELVAMNPASAGNYSDFTNDYTNLDEPGFDFSDLVYTTATATRESWVYSSPAYVATDKVIYAFITNVVVQTDLANIVSDFQPFLRISATDYAGTNVGAINIAPNSYINIWTQNPDTLAPWQPSDFTAMESGVLAV